VARHVVDVDHNLNTAINKIREVLNDSAESPLSGDVASPRLSVRGPIESAQTDAPSASVVGQTAKKIISSPTYDIFKAHRYPPRSLLCARKLHWLKGKNWGRFAPPPMRLRCDLLS
jgi:hypothetical protein